MTRPDGRAPDELRPTRFELDYTRWAEGSVLVRTGNTHILCNVTVTDKLPGWLHRQGAPHGWLTAEYALLPRSTQQRVARESRWPKGRTQEISRLIGRSLRLAVDLKALGNRQLVVDCDVLQADGGTRTAAITGAWVAVQIALRPLIERGQVAPSVMRHQLAAVSVGLVDGERRLDLEYGEDMAASVDLNLVLTAAGEVVEIQGTAEREPLSRADLDALVALGAQGINDLVARQQAALNPS